MLARNFFLDKNRITNQNFHFYITCTVGIQLLFAYPEIQVEICLVILFLSRQTSRQTFYAKQMFVLSSSMKWGPGICLVDKCNLHVYLHRYWHKFLTNYLFSFPLTPMCKRLKPKTYYSSSTSDQSK